MREEEIISLIYDIEENKELIYEIPVKKLGTILDYASDKYYNTGVSVVSDDMFDIIKDIVLEKNPKHKIGKKIGAKVGEDKVKVKLPFHMGSLDKIKPGSGALERWLKTYGGPYVIMDKLDGVSALLHKRGNSIHLYTRGDGSTGTDITNLIQYIPSIKLDRLPNNLSVRGELIISKQKFKKYEQVMSNGRNMVSGLVNSKSVDANILKDIDFICYELIEPMSQIDQLASIRSFGLKDVEYVYLDFLEEGILSDILSNRKKDSKYEMDGVVVVDNSIHKKNISGNPKYAFAFKTISDLEYEDVKVLGIEWNISKDGLIKPIVKIEPTQISGVVIKNVTGHNAKNIIDNKISKGAVVRVVRSGGVIPHILSVIKQASSIQYPDVPYKWNETEVDLMYIGKRDDSEQLLVKNLTNFFKKIDTKWISESTIIKFVNAGFVTIKQIVHISKKDLLKLESFGEKMTEKIYNSIQTSIENVELVDLMCGSNIFGSGFGQKKIGFILQKYPDIVTTKTKNDKLVELITEIDGFDVLTAGKFVEHLDEFRNFLKDLGIKYNNKYQKQQLRVEPELHREAGPKIDSPKHNFNGQKIVFTGFRNKELENLITSSGGQVTTSISKNTNMLICVDKDEQSSKLQKAKELGINILSLEEFKKRYKIKI